MLIFIVVILLIISFFIGSTVAIKENNNYVSKYNVLKHQSWLKQQEYEKEIISLKAKLMALEKNYPLALELKKEFSRRAEERAKFKKPFSGWGYRLQMMLDEEHLTLQKAAEKLDIGNVTLLRKYLAERQLPKIEHLISIIQYFRPDLNWFINGDD